MIKKTYIYEVTGFMPPLDGQHRMGGHGFNIRLHGQFAQKLMEVELSQTGYENLLWEAREIIDKIMGPSGILVREPISFWDDRVPDKATKALLTNITVPGNACGLDVDWGTLDRVRRRTDAWIDYLPHNVDGHMQSYCLLSIFFCWANRAGVLIDWDEE